MEDLKNLIENYQPTQEAIDLINQMKVVFLVGVAGAGKDTIVNQLLKSGDFHRIVTHTTRLPRYDSGRMEVDGIDRHFINNEKAIQMLKNHELIEAKFVHGDTVYGTSVDEFRYADSQGKIAIANIDVQGVEEYTKITKNVVTIFVVPPSYDIWIKRLRGRYNSEAEFQSAWLSRKKSAINEIDFALKSGYYKFIVNDGLDVSVSDAKKIIDNHYDELYQVKSIKIAKDLLKKLTK